MIKVLKEPVIKQLGGLSREVEISQEVEKIIDTEIIESKNYLIQQKVVKLCDLELLDGGELIISKDFHIRSMSLSKRLESCIFVYLFAVTVGDLLTKRMNDYIKMGEITKGIIIDAIGSVAVEAFADKVNDEIIEICRKQGFNATKRFSPGYGDWSIRDQSELLAILKSKNIGLVLNENYQMKPEKSISAVIGFF